MTKLRKVPRHPQKALREKPQLCHLKEAEGQLVLTLEKIEELTKELKQKDEAITKAEQVAYNLGQTETEAHLKAQLVVVCRGFRLRTWVEALNVAGLDQSSELRNPEKVVYPPTFKVKAGTPAQGSVAPSAPQASTEASSPTQGNVAPSALLAFIKEKGSTQGDIAPSASQATAEEQSS